ncbi:permease [Psychromonas antarctica]|uniref:permease n=1 Tax=Psychromonas antarctica TaxID=67573 RepID=UPI001EE8E755|nr:permease [Psychromonas antarctica]MCG6200068.1 permease [Psychromonas antarctica]
MLLLSIFALFLGPITYRLFQRQPGWLDLLDAFIFVTISGLVFLHILPEILHTGGFMVLLLMAMGMLAPSWIEKYFHRAAHQAHQTTLFLGVLGLVLHASIDGSALIVSEADHTGWLLAIGVLLHRFPVGLTIWWLLRPQYGRLLPLAILLTMSAATLGGGLLAGDSLLQLDGQWLAWFQAFVMGSIMHVVLHRPYLHGHAHVHSAHETSNENRYAAGIGSLLGVIVLASVLLPHWLGYIEDSHDNSTEIVHSMALQNSDTLLTAVQDDSQALSMPLHQEEMDDDHQQLGDAVNHQSHETALTLLNFTNIALHSAPMLLLAYLLSGLMHYFKPKFAILPQQNSQSFLKDSLKGVLYGLPLPVCSPSARKMHQQLLDMGASQTFATAFLIAAPIIGFDALLISLPLLGVQMLLLRIALATVFACAVAWLLGRHFTTAPCAALTISGQGEKSTSRFINAIRQGYQHQLDHTAPWVLLGWTLAATLSATPAWAFFDQALWLQILVMIIVALPLSLCATGITPVIAVLLIAGLSPGAAIAFLLIAPTISLEFLQTFKQQQGIFAAISLAMLMLGGAFLIGLALNQYIDVISLPWLAQPDTAYSWWNIGSLTIILLLYFSSLLRRGARRFIAELIPQSLLKSHHH